LAIGLYIHVPFCIKKCSYCDFVSYPYEAGLAASYVHALGKEMALHAEGMTAQQRTVRSVYLGGGTPTVLSGEQIASIMEGCRRHFNFTGDVEVTVECNPGTVDLAKLKIIKEAGVNRLSMGVQAYQQKMLSRLGRIHTWKQVVEAVSRCREAGFENLSLDLMFGIPGQTMAHWKETLKRVLELSPQHISAYNLKIEPDTPLHRDITSGYLVPCDEGLEVEMYWYTIDFLTGHGFNHYEISNFALPCREAQHNLLYWHNEEYLGLGPAAHSMLGNSRFSNVENVESYIRRLNNNSPVITEKRVLTWEEQVSETVFLALRLTGGIDLKAFEQRFGGSLFDIFRQQIGKLVRLGLLEKNDNNLKITKKGLPLANEVFLEFV